jgi:pimeloyl-ACP methyl ester carboxylesterase
VGDALLLLHAFPVDSRMWRPQMDAFEGDVQVVAPNHPGFGGRSDGPEVMAMALAAESAVNALDSADVQRAVVCGLSMGGYVALELWRRHPGRVMGLVFANTRSGADGEEAAARRRELAERLRREGKDFFVDGPPGLLSEHAPEDLRRIVREIIADQPAEALAAASLGMAERPDSGPDLAGIDVATLVLTGADDTLIPSSVTAEMAKAIPGARLGVIDGAGHLSNLEQPEEFNRLLGEHLALCGLG